MLSTYTVSTSIEWINRTPVRSHTFNQIVLLNTV
jgi:hypothetical protein